MNWLWKQYSVIYRLIFYLMSLANQKAKLYSIVFNFNWIAVFLYFSPILLSIYYILYLIHCGPLYNSILKFLQICLCIITNVPSHSLSLATPQIRQLFIYLLKLEISFVLFKISYKWKHTMWLLSHNMCWRIFLYT